MRAGPLLFAAAALAALAAALLLSRGTRAPSPGPAAAPAAPAGGDERLDSLAAENRRLREEIGRLRAEVEEIRESVRAILSRPPPGPGGEAADPSALLDRYVLSFADGGEGAKYYELAVDAAAPALRDGIARVVLDPGAATALRARLAEMLGGARFRGDRTAIRTLLDAIRPDAPEPLVRAALAGLATIADAGAAGALEARVWELPPSLRDEALGTIVALAGDGANRAILRLLLSAPDDGSRARAVSLAATSDPETAMEIFARAFGMEPAVRSAAAARIAAFRGGPFRDLVAGRLAVEDDPGVLRVLTQSAATQTQIPRWDAMRATGPPDVDDVTRDHQNAWASRSPDAGREWLELSYPAPIRLTGVRIHEVYVAGAVAEVLARGPDGAWQTLWQGTDPLAAPGVFEVAFPATTYRTDVVRIVLDTARRPGWNEIDTVEAVGPDGRAFPVAAVASSNYGQ